jgi:hypothetical protein
MNTIEINHIPASVKTAPVKKTKVLYWIFTTLLVLIMFVGAIPNILAVPEAQALFNHLGYPVYLLPFLGVAKTLGVLAILVPGFPRLKEWAYAGFTFDLAGAMYSGIAIGDPAGSWVPIFIGFICIAGSYMLYHQLRSAAK